MMRNINFIKTIAIQLLFTSCIYAQTCNESSDLLYETGRYVDASKTPLGGFVSDFNPNEKIVALKTLKTLEPDVKKVCLIKGGVAQAFFHFAEQYYFDKYAFKTYTYKIGFYNYSCVKGKIVESSEYISDFSVTINPSINPYFGIPQEYASYGSNFDAIPGKNGLLKIPLLSYLVFENEEHLEKLNSGEGYFDDTNEISSNMVKDIYRTWYIIPKNKKIVVEVSRKEYLESLLEFYERENIASSKKYNIMIREANENIPKYQKNGNQAMVQSHLENKQDAEKAIEKYLLYKETKSAAVKKLLQSKSEEWLMQVAKINPKIRNSNYCDSYKDFDATGYFTFKNFCETSEGKKVCKLNPDLFKEQAKAPATPLFLKVSFRYKSNTPFTLNIKEGFIKNIDFETLRKIIQ
jgi:hypothetical protein